MPEWENVMRDDGDGPGGACGYEKRIKIIKIEYLGSVSSHNQQAGRHASTIHLNAS